MNAATLLDLLSWILMLSGGLFAIIGGWGMHSLDDFFARTHAASVTDTAGAGLIIIGLLLQAPGWIVVIKLLMILLFLWFTSPTATHILAQAAISDGLKPRLAKNPSGPSDNRRNKSAAS